MAHKAHYVNGKRVPSVTTVLKQLGWGKEGLLYWANQQGLDGNTLEDARRPALDAGTAAHDMIDAHVKGIDYDMHKLDSLPANTRKAAIQGFESFLKWAEQTRMRLRLSEVDITSTAHRFGGTLDCIADVAGELCLVDWKTSNGVYPDYIAQIAAYGKGWLEGNPGEPLEGYHLLRVGKADASFAHHYWAADSNAIQAGWEVFKHARELYELEKVLKKA